MFNRDEQVNSVKDCITTLDNKSDMLSMYCYIFPSIMPYATCSGGSYYMIQNLHIFPLKS